MSNLENISAFLGVDVQSTRGCPYVVLDTDLKPHVSGWLETPEEISGIVDEITRSLRPVAVGIDAPRCALQAPRNHYWEPKNGGADVLQILAMVDTARLWLLHYE
jgi:hypothetical protein